MEFRYSPDLNGFDQKTRNELADSFLINLFEQNKIVMVYSDIDRVITGSAVPLNEELKLTVSKKEMATDYFTERREVGIINIGGMGSIVADGQEYNMDFKDALYIGRGTKDISFRSKDSKKPSKYYLTSYPAHTDYPIAHVKCQDAAPVKLGSKKDSNVRTIYKYIHPNGIQSCQLVMGLTELEEGSVWNTMPAHTHERRSEVYMYFNIDDDNFVVHLIGKADNTKHIIVRNEQAVLSPSWSVHSGAGTQNYSFIWSMGGENQDFDDMDWIPLSDIK